MEIFGVPYQALLGQLFIGLVNGSFYAVLSLGLAIIFGLLNVVNFAHGALYMLGALVTWMGLNYLGLSYWVSLLVAPFIVGSFGMLCERTMIRRLRGLDPIYGLLLTFGMAQVVQSLASNSYGVTGLSYTPPSLLQGAADVGFMRLPIYRAWVVVASMAVCLSTWYVIERTRLGSYLRAGTENPSMVQAFGINLPLIVTLTYGFGAGLAAFAGVLAAPVVQVSPLMGADMVVVVFAVVVVGGMGSILGSIVTGVLLGVVEGLTRVYYPPASNVVIFAIMAVVLMFRPSGLFGQQK